MCIYSPYINFSKRVGKTLSIIALILASNEIQTQDEEDLSSSSDNESDHEDEGSQKARKYRPDSFWKQFAKKIPLIFCLGSSLAQYYGGTLVVAPASLIEQWQTEVEKRVKRNSISVLLHHGNNREDRARRVSKYDLVITTYGVVSSEDKNRGPLQAIKWERIVLDEAHIIRNHNTAGTFALMVLILSFCMVRSIQ